MSKKKKRNKIQKETHKQQLNPKQPGVIKISEAILKLSEPLRNKYPDPHRIQSIISLTVLAWNISLFPEEERIHLQEMVVDLLPKEFAGEDVSILLDNIETLIERKEKEFRDIREYIVNHQVSFSGDSLSLTVGTSPVLEKIKKRPL